MSSQNSHSQSIDTDPHPEWLALWREPRAAVNQPSPQDADDHPAWAQYEALTQRILHTPAQTPAGVAAQLLLAEEQACGLNDATITILRQAVAMLAIIQPDERNDENVGQTVQP